MKVLYWDLASEIAFEWQHRKTSSPYWQVGGCEKRWS